MRPIFFILPFLVLFQLASNAADNVSHLKGINFLYMNVDTRMASDIKLAERLDLTDIMELQLRRGGIMLRPLIANQPMTNVPLVELSVDTSGTGATDYTLILQVKDFVTIDRNKEKTIATTFELRRSGSHGGSSNEIDGIKAELRELMAEFVDHFKSQNP